MNSEYIYVSLDIVKEVNPLFNDFSDDSKFIRKHFPKLMYLVSCIYFNQVTKKLHKSEFVNLNSELLRKVIGSRYLIKVRSLLIEKSIIECDFDFKIKNKSFAFRLTERFWRSKFTRHETNLNVNFKTTTLNSNHKYLKEQLDFVEIDVHLAEKVILDTEPTIEQLDCAMFNVNAINSKDHYFKTDEKTGRIFTHITNMPRYLRKIITFHGETPVEIDIKTSQPLLFNCLYEQECAESIKLRLITEDKDNDFYYYISSRTHFDEKDEDYLEEMRKTLKTDLYKVLFAGWIDPRLYEVEQVFKNEFPILYKKMQQIKKGEYKHATLPILLQKLEAGVIIEKVVDECRAQNIPILTIHDSFLTLQRHVDELKSLIIKQFKKEFNLAPVLVEK